MYVLTRRGLALARRLETALDMRLYVSDRLFAASSASSPEDYARADGAAPLSRLDPLARHALSSGGQAGARRPPCRFSRLPDLLRACFQNHACHIFITAAGIAVRSVAPFLRGKSLDPAVLVIDQRGRFVISLLSGHLGGGNAMAATVAARLGAVPVITTATDVENLPALDALAKDRGLAIADLGAVKAVSAALLDGAVVSLHDPDDCLGIRESGWEGLFQREPDLRRALETAGPETDAPPERTGPDGAPGARVRNARVIVTERAAPLFQGSNCLILHPRRLFMGIGCRRGTPVQDILEHIRLLLASSGLAPEAVAGLASIEAKRGEKGLIRAAEILSLPLLFFSPAELAAYPVGAPSPVVMRCFGIPGVCEAAALAAAGPGAGLLIPKTAGGNVALALARADVARRTR